MAALTAGSKAPEFELKAMDGSRFVLRDELARGPLVLAFLKASCPTPVNTRSRFWSDWSGRTGTKESGSSGFRRMIPSRLPPSQKNSTSRFPCSSTIPIPIRCRMRTA